MELATRPNPMLNIVTYLNQSRGLPSRQGLQIQVPKDHGFLLFLVQLQRGHLLERVLQRLELHDHWCDH
jgi:hypothetical protein